MNKTNLTTNWTLKIAAAVLAGLGAASLAGCQGDKSSVTEFFPSDNAPRATEQFMAVQAASGARADSTLQPLHFDNEKLNSLGEAKLDLMLKDDDSVEPVVVYMNLSKDDKFMNSRRESVSRYLVDRGLSEDQVKFETGVNPHSRSMAARHMNNMSKTDTGAGGGGYAGSASQGVAGVGPTAGGMADIAK